MLLASGHRTRALCTYREATPRVRSKFRAPEVRAHDFRTTLYCCFSCLILRFKRAYFLGAIKRIQHPRICQSHNLERSNKPSARRAIGRINRVIVLVRACLGCNGEPIRENHNFRSACAICHSMSNEA